MERTLLASLLFVLILPGNIILRHFMRANFRLVSVPGVFHALHRFGLERVSLLEQLVHTLGIRTLDVGQSLQISRLLTRPSPRSPQSECRLAMNSNKWPSTSLK